MIQEIAPEAFFKWLIIKLHPTPMNRIQRYVRETIIEMKHVTWPTQSQAFVYTALVVGISAFTALFLGTFDHLFSQALNLFLLK